MLSQRY